jgi:hypothetical protein
MAPNFPATVTIPENVAWQQFAGEVVLVDLNAGEYHNLNAVAGRMWQALDECDDVEAAHAQLCALYEIDATTLSQDLAAFIQQLVDKGLLTVP